MNWRYLGSEVWRTDEETRGVPEAIAYNDDGEWFAKRRKLADRDGPFVTADEAKTFVDNKENR